ncbi:MAG TPA: M56 family metallopeptidase, partial [Verrucomicrobiae bacterium]|nr:M56 family metallopeptidase [Verrucomicrobiae bacterium]
MNLSAWIRLAACLATETTLLLAVAALLEYCLRSPRAARTIWQAALATVALVWNVQLSGLHGAMPAASLKKTRYLIFSRILPPSVQQSKTNDKASPTEVAPAMPVSDIVKWPAWLWLAGSTLLLSRFCLARVWLAVRELAALPADEESRRLIARWQTGLGLAHLRSQVWPGLPSPIAFGILRPAIALPPDFLVRFSSAEREAVLAHEMAHLAARDPFWLMVSDAAAALAWWHPLLWWARHRLQSASESAADEASALVPGGAHALAECLVRLGHELTAPHPAR